MFTPDLSLGDSMRSTPAGSDFILPFFAKQVFLSSAFEPPRYRDATQLIPADAFFLRAGTLDGTSCFVCGLPAPPAELPSGLAAIPARRLLSLSSPDLPQCFCRGRELLFWLRNHRYCGACRAEMSPSHTDSAMICPDCSARYYPQIAPAVITAILREGTAGGEILLGHNRNFEDGLYSLIAGFVEAGESAEQAAVREIAEETGVRIRNLRYVSSQVWPFPNSLMLGFTAEYESGEPVPDGTELTSLEWFPLNHLPKIPERGSIARAILDMLRGLQ